MPRHYVKKLGGRTYGNYTQEKLEQALAAIRGGMSQARASQRFKIPRGTLQNKLFGRHTKAVGHPTIFTREEEALLTHTLTTVSDWGFPLTKTDIREVLKKYLEKKGRTVKEFTDNKPGHDFIEHFITRNNLSVRLASNIKRSRASVGAQLINEFFTNIEPVLKDTDPALVFNYDETNVQDDPGAKKVIVSRGTRRVERVQQHSKAAVSIMVCGSANGILLPPMVVYKAGHLYENWTNGGPLGTVYACSQSGWFDMPLFEKWFFQILLPHLNEMNNPGKKIIIGDNLASHFSPEVIKSCEENNIYLTPLPPNSTHLMQPLDVAVFAPMKKKWREILDKWRKESRSSGSIPKEQFPILLSRLWNGVSENVSKNLSSGFRATGLCPFQPNEVLKRIPNREAETSDPELLNSSIVELLQEMRGADKTVVRKRGKRMEPGKALGVTITQKEPSNSPVPTELEEEIAADVEEPKKPQKSKRQQPKSKKLKATASIATSEPQPGPSGIKLPSRVAKAKSQDRCSVCYKSWLIYSGPDWIACVECHRWVCGFCNEQSKDPFYVCPICQNIDFDSDDSLKDRNFMPSDKT